MVGDLDLGRRPDRRRASASQPGLLAAAHGGVLYVDEVNLLPDHLVDVLLDVAASGVNRVERDGVVARPPEPGSCSIGSMNPEEGELRPQLLDRFGLAVDVRRADRSGASGPRPCAAGWPSTPTRSASPATWRPTRRPGRPPGRAPARRRSPDDLRRRRRPLVRVASAPRGCGPT